MSGPLSISKEVKPFVASKQSHTLVAPSGGVTEPVPFPTGTTLQSTADHYFCTKNSMQPMTGETAPPREHSRGVWPLFSFSPRLGDDVAHRDVEHTTIKLLPLSQRVHPSQKTLTPLQAVAEDAGDSMGTDTQHLPASKGWHLWCLSAPHSRVLPLVPMMPIKAERDLDLHRASPYSHRYTGP